MATLQFSVALRNAELDALETATGGTAVLKIRNGTMPSACGSADVGTVLATMNLPADWMAAASGGSKALSGTWQDGTADATGTATHFRLYANDGSTCCMQGDVTLTAGGGAMTLDNTSIAQNQQVTITTFTLTAGNA